MCIMPHMNKTSLHKRFLLPAKAPSSCFTPHCQVEGPSLWNTEPSGTYTKYMACAIGSAQEGATNLLQEQYNKDTDRGLSQDAEK